MSETVERLLECAGAATRALVIAAAVVICTPFMVLCWVAYRLGLWR
jgi:hypothetical protein